MAQESEPPTRDALKKLNKDFGVHLRKLRDQQERTQTDIAHELGVGQPFVSKLETGEYAVKLLEVPALARAYRTDANELWAWAHEAATTGAGVTVDKPTPPAPLAKVAPKTRGPGPKRPRRRRPRAYTKGRRHPPRRPPIGHRRRRPPGRRPR